MIAICQWHSNNDPPQVRLCCGEDKDTKNKLFKTTLAEYMTDKQITEDIIEFDRSQK